MKFDGSCSMQTHSTHHHPPLPRPVFSLPPTNHHDFLLALLVSFSLIFFRHPLSPECSLPSRWLTTQRTPSAAYITLCTLLTPATPSLPIQLATTKISSQNASTTSSQTLLPSSGEWISNPNATAIVSFPPLVYDKSNATLDASQMTIAVTEHVHVRTPT